MKHFINLKDIPAKDLKKIITDGKIIKRPADEDGRFYSLFYNNREYFVEIIYNLNMKSYSCVGFINPN